MSASKQSASKKLTSTADISDFKKELILLWLMLTANGVYDPANSGYRTPDDILNKIATAFNQVDHGTWNWNALGHGVALKIAKVAFDKSASFHEVNRYFRFNVSVLASTDTNPWPPDGPPDHPSVAEIRAAFNF